MRAFHDMLVRSGMRTEKKNIFYVASYIRISFLDLCVIGF